MRLRILAISILAVVSSMACSHDDGGKKNPTPSYTELTDKSQCGIGTATSIEGTWSFTLASGPAQVKSIWAISRSSVTVTNQCSVNGQSAQAKATASSSYTSNQLNILGSDYDSSPIAGTTCPSRLAPETVTYQFTGSCLQINESGTIMTLVPENRGGNQVSQNQNQTQSGFQPMDRSQVPTDSDFQMPAMPKMPKMPTMPQVSSQDDND